MLLLLAGAFLTLALAALAAFYLGLWSSPDTLTRNATAAFTTQATIASVIRDADETATLESRRRTGPSRCQRYFGALQRRSISASIREFWVVDGADIDALHDAVVDAISELGRTPRVRDARDEDRSVTSRVTYGVRAQTWVSLQERPEGRIHAQILSSTGCVPIRFGMFDAPVPDRDRFWDQTDPGGLTVRRNSQPSDDAP